AEAVAGPEAGVRVEQAATVGRPRRRALGFLVENAQMSAAGRDDLEFVAVEERDVSAVRREGRIFREIRELSRRGKDREHLAVSVDDEQSADRVGDDDTAAVRRP